jgi:hypothetical protein
MTIIFTSLSLRFDARFGVDKTILKIQADPAFFNLHLSVATLACIGSPIR